MPYIKKPKKVKQESDADLSLEKFAEKVNKSLNLKENTALLVLSCMRDLLVEDYRL